MVKIPRFAFEKFPGADAELTTTMKSVGEAMALGRNFVTALNKAMRSVETTAAGFWTVADPAGEDLDAALAALRVPADGRLYPVERALRLGATVEQVRDASGGYDPWFVAQIGGLVELGERRGQRVLAGPDGSVARAAPRCLGEGHDRSLACDRDDRHCRR